MSKDLAEFYKHNLWANLRLLDKCATLTDEQLDLAAPGTYGSVQDCRGRSSRRSCRPVSWTGS